jgi:hypothetical protein
LDASVKISIQLLLRSLPAVRDDELRKDKKECYMYKKILVITISLFLFKQANAQVLHLKARKAEAMTGSVFANSIADSTLSLEAREHIIYNEIKSGNVPDFLRKLVKISKQITIGGNNYTIEFFTLPDYMAIGSNNDYFYIPMTPILAQKVATLTKSSLPTKQMVDLIYKNATIKLSPQPIPPTKAMTTVPVFITHNKMVQEQLIPFLVQHQQSGLTAGHKKDIIISNKIYTEKTAKVVIYGWHQPDGKAIQPVYNKHSNTWADYSHGVRLIQSKVFVNGKKTTITKVLAHPVLNQLLSDEGVIKKAYYSVTTY